MRRAAFFALGLLLSVTAAGVADVPATILYEGLLTDAAGAPQDGDFNLTFRLYTQASGGAPIWTEVHAGVTVANGVFQVTLGQTTTLPAFDRPYWISIAVGGTELPRVAMAASPYALAAKDALGIGGRPVAIAGTPGDGTVLTYSAATGSWTAQALPGGGQQVTKFIPINVYGTSISGSASFGQGFSDRGGVLFPDSSTPEQPQLDYGFVLPEDYVPGTDVVLEIIWMSPATSGAVNIRHNWGTIQRVGTAAINFNTPDPGLVNLPSTSALVVKTNIVLNRSESFLAGDAIVHGIFRSTSDSATGTVSIGGLRVRYTGQR